MTNVVFPDIAPAFVAHKLSLIKEGRKKILSIVAVTDWSNEQSMKTGRALISAAKGSYSRKLKQFLKSAFVMEFVELNKLEDTYSCYNNVCKAVFDESINHTLLASFEKSKRYGVRVPPVQVVFGEEVFESVKSYYQNLYPFERLDLLSALSYDRDSEKFFTSRDEIHQPPTKSGVRKI